MPHLSDTQSKIPVFQVKLECLAFLSFWEQNSKSNSLFFLLICLFVLSSSLLFNPFHGHLCHQSHDGYRLLDFMSREDARVFPKFLLFLPIIHSFSRCQNSKPQKIVFGGHFQVLYYSQQTIDKILHSLITLQHQMR